MGKSQEIKTMSDSKQNYNIDHQVGMYHWSGIPTHSTYLMMITCGGNRNTCIIVYVYLYCNFIVLSLISFCSLAFFPFLKILLCIARDIFEIIIFILTASTQKCKKHLHPIKKFIPTIVSFNILINKLNPLYDCPYTKFILTYSLPVSQVSKIPFSRL